MAIPTRILEQIHNSELDAKDFYSLYGKENIETALNGLKKSDEEIFNTYSVQEMKAAVAGKITANKLGFTSKAANNNTFKFTGFKLVSYAAAAVLLAALIIPTGIIADMDHLFQFEFEKDSEPLELTDENAVIPTSVFLGLYPRSSLGFKYGMRLLNTVGIIDSDYAHNESNEGHIMVGIICSKPMRLEQGTKFCQGIIQPYFVMEDDQADGERTGGMGSTGVK